MSGCSETVRWCCRGWDLRLHAITTNAEDISCRHLFTLAQRYAKASVITALDLSEVNGKGFVIAAASSSGDIRIQAWWWTREGDLHRTAAVMRQDCDKPERMAPWDIASAMELPVVLREVADNRGQSTN